MHKPDLGSPTPWRQSLRASQERRAAAARSRRRHLRSRRAIAATLLACGLTAGGALAASGGAAAGSATSTGATGSTASAPAPASPTASVQKALGLKADGVAGPKTRAAIRSYERRHHLKVDGRIGPALLKSLRISTAAPTATAASTGDAASILAQVAQCESGDDPTAISSDGQYRGKYQFDEDTWAQMGGQGTDPAAAPEAEQDRVAMLLYQQQGLKPWPVCGQQVAAGSGS